MNELKKSIHDNANGLDYTLVNDHYLPNLTTAAPAEHPTGRWGRLHKKYLKEQHPIRYNQLLLSGELGGYLAKLDKQAEEQLALTVLPFFDSSYTFSLFTFPSDNKSLSNNEVSNCLLNSLTDQFELIHSFS